MRAVQLTAYGNPAEALKYVDIPGGFGSERFF